MAKKKIKKQSKKTTTPITNNKDESENVSSVVWNDLKKLPDIFTSFFTKVFSRIKNFIETLPKWIKARPEAIRAWVKEDRKLKKYRSFHLQKKINPEPRYIPSPKLLFKQSFLFLWKNKKIFIGIMAIYTLIYVVLIRAPFMTDARTIVTTVQTVLGEKGASSLSGNLATLSAVLGSTSSGGNAIAVSLATLVMSLVYIWAIRQRTNGQEIRIRDAYFQSMTPLLSVIVVLLIISVQLIPLGVSSFVYTTARGNSLFTSGFEDLTFFIITILLGLLSLYWISSTLMAVYATSLQGVYPLSALVIARRLTKFQRFTVFKRVIALPIVLGIIYILLLLLFIRFASDYILYVSEGYQIIILPFIHTYLYKLYRALI